jgi:putative NADH-flavin reductase
MEDISPAVVICPTDGEDSSHFQLGMDDFTSKEEYSR